MNTKSNYTIGIDFDTEIARAVLVDVSNGNIFANADYKYPHGVIKDKLPKNEIELEPGWSLFHPEDYKDAIKALIPPLLRQSQIEVNQIIGIGIDATGSTILPTTKDGTPLCLLEDYEDQPHAWPKLWNHAADIDKANQLTQLATDRFETFLDRYGGKIDPEWFFPKVWELYDDASSTYNAADRIIEASDWIVWQLTGIETRNICAAGYKALWAKNEGFPLETFFSAMDPHLANVVDKKMKREIKPLGEQAGELTEEAAQMMGLNPGIPVATGLLHTHAVVPGSTVAQPGKMALILGSNFNHIILSNKEFRVPGMSGMVEDGIVPGLIGYEATQTGGGNHFSWFMDNAIPVDYLKAAQKRNISIYQLMEEKAAMLQPAESGMVALDWWNANRSILADNDLTGLILGYSLETKPEEIYRTLLEATTFGTRKIFETFIASGIPINEIIVSGSDLAKNRLLLTILANVTRMEIKFVSSPYTAALGSSMYAAVAAGEGRNGYGTIQEASRKMAHLDEKTFLPNNTDKKTYNRLYSEYTLLHDYFGYGHNNAMKRLKNLRTTILEKKNR